jgi:hypothetical protein
LDNQGPPLRRPPLASGPHAIVLGVTEAHPDAFSESDSDGAGTAHYHLEQREHAGTGSLSHEDALRACPDVEDREVSPVPVAPVVTVSGSGGGGSGSLSGASGGGPGAGGAQVCWGAGTSDERSLFARRTVLLGLHIYKVATSPSLCSTSSGGSSARANVVVDASECVRLEIPLGLVRPSRHHF